MERRESSTDSQPGILDSGFRRNDGLGGAGMTVGRLWRWVLGGGKVGRGREGTGLKPALTEVLAVGFDPHPGPPPNRGREHLFGVFLLGRGWY